MGICLNAWATDGSQQPAFDMNDIPSVIMAIAKVAGLPGVIGYIGLRFGQTIGQNGGLVMVVRLHSDDRKEISSAITSMNEMSTKMASLEATFHERTREHKDDISALQNIRRDYESVVHSIISRIDNIERMGVKPKE